ncbi:glycosyl transferase [Mycobacterium vulneris]|uniref:glycosyltransferase n=1 Tax=Mycolicibacterium porcinum TaxID=39693 RepID=UPI00080AEBAB|nr:glycosyltransferase [Mycolicibacterium porcinum]OCB52807.1 glycosyl transferase [Mycolicibacterium vulneris]OCB64479.1 glycosyl transferase [Mycolicibacterium vulneris]ODR25858.1 glycosyl transferase [Mycolicibacterium porcinum]
MTARLGHSGTVFDQAVVVIPAHNEAALLPRCLRAVTTAAACWQTPVLVVVVLDSCDDSSAQLAHRFGNDVHFISVQAGSVGASRAAGFAYARSLCNHVDDSRVWYATTDADSRVDPDWLVRQTAPAVDMVLGVVRVADWRHHPAELVRHYLHAYESDMRGINGHNHIHGANMGFRADAYWRLGGFRPLATGEDVELVERFETASYRIRRDASLSVTTSARRNGRAPGGFAGYLRDLSRSVFPSAERDSA